MRKIVCLLCMLVATPALCTETVASMQERAEASMLVTGSIDIAPDGTLSSMAIDHRQELPAEVASLIDRASAKWRFPADPSGDADTRHVAMTLRIVARTEPDGAYRSRIRGATFGDRKLDGQIRYKSRVSPRYPLFAYQNRISGDVYLLLRVDASGKVTDVAAEQVNLDTVTEASMQAQIRKLFAEVCVNVAKYWTFDVTGAGNLADGAWLVRVPVHFGMVQDRATQNYGKWLVYVPGPHEPVRWLGKYNYPQPASNTDALPGGSLQPVQNQLAVIGPLDGD